MQILIKSTRVIKEGKQTKTGQPYKWCSVIADDGTPKGTEYTTFDAGVLRLGPGSVIDIGEPIIKEGKLSFKEIVTVISEVAAVSQPVKTNGSHQLSDEQCLKLKAEETASIEAQTAYNGIIELAKQGEVDDKFKRLYEKALDWADIKLDATMPKVAESKKPEPAPNGEKKADAPKEDEAPGIANAGQFLTKCVDTLGYAKATVRVEVLTALGLSNFDEIKDFNKAFLKLAEMKAGKKT